MTKSGREALPDVRECSRGTVGCPGVVGGTSICPGVVERHSQMSGCVWRPSRMSGSGREALPDVQ